MGSLPTFEGQPPDLVKFSFTGSVEMSDDETQTALAMLGTEHAAYVIGMVEGAKYAFAMNRDDELVLTVALRVLAVAEDTSGTAAEEIARLEHAATEPAVPFESATDYADETEPSEAEFDDPESVDDELDD